MPPATVNTAVIGCGLFGQVHAAAYEAFERSNLVAVCDLDADRAAKLARRFDCRCCTSLAEVAADPNIQAASVVTPDFAHRDACVALAQAGKHLLVEKPLATTVQDAEAIVRAAADAGVVAMVDFHNRRHPALTAVKQRLDRGELGRPQMMFARLSDRLEVATEWFTWSGQSGPEWFLGSHLVDVACWMFAEDPLRVFAEARKGVLASRGIDCHDSMHIHLSFPSGFATLETSWILPRSWPMVCDFYVSLQTTRGRADVDMSHQGAAIASADSYDRPMLAGATPVGHDCFGFFAFPIHDFVRAVLGEAAPSMPLADGLKNVKIIAAAVESAETAQPVELAGRL